MRETLPPGWISTTLGEIILLNPKSDMDDELEASFIPMSFIPTDYSSSVSYKKKKWGEIKRGHTHFKNGDVLFAKITPCFENSKAAIIKNLKNGIGCGSTEYYVLRPIKKMVEPNLLLALVKFQSFLKAGESLMTGTVGQKRVPKDFVLNYPFPLPPLNEQKRISAKLDQIMPRINALKERLGHIPQIIKRFRQSMLTAAVTGKLTEKWREEHPDLESADALLARIKAEREKEYLEECEEAKKEGRRKPKPYKKDSNHTVKLEIPSAWKSILTSYLFYFVTSGSRGWARYYSNDGALFIRITNLDYNSIEIDLRPEKIQRVKLPENVEGKRTKIKPGDFLFSITGDVGMLAIANENIAESYVNQHIALARPIKVYFNKFLGYFFKSQAGGLSQLKSLQKGVTKAGLGLDDIVNVLAPVPPVAEQKEIVRQVDALFAFADKLEEHYKKSKERIDKLAQSVLAKAFRGELVVTEVELARREGRTFESAEELLKRIKEEKIRLETEMKKNKKSAARK